jgi:ribosome-associated protein
MQTDSENFDEEEEWGPSKSAVKREHHAMRDLAKHLTELSDKELATIPLNENISNAIATARKLKQGGGLRRQISYIGKIFSREEEEDQQAIKNAYEELLNGRQQQSRHFHRIEIIRDKLLEQGLDAIESIIADYPNADRQHLRQLILQANKEKKANKPPATARKLFVYLRELMAAKNTATNEAINGNEIDEEDDE